MVYEDFVPVQIFDLDIQALKNSFQTLKAKRKLITGTLLDYVNDDEVEKIKQEKNYDLGIYEPTPKFILEHIQFTTKVLHALLEKYPNDEYLRNLKTESMFIERISTNWYERYGLKYIVKSVD